NILEHMTLGYDNKIRPETLLELGIEERHMNLRPLSKMNEVQRASWDAVYDPIDEAFRKAYPHMNDSTLTLWKYQRYLQDYLATIASVDDNVGRLLNYLEEKGLEK